MDASLLWQIGGTLAAAAAAYGAIRADLKGMHERIGRIEVRLDNHIDKGVEHGNA
jgi:hypothetical protein